MKQLRLAAVIIAASLIGMIIGVTYLVFLITKFPYMLATQPIKTLRVARRDINETLARTFGKRFVSADVSLQGQVTRVVGYNFRGRYYGTEVVHDWNHPKLNGKDYSCVILD